MHKRVFLHTLLESGDELVHELTIGSALHVGRERERVDVLVPELYCSRLHLRIERTSTTRIVLHDLGGRTGTLLALGVAERLEIARRLLRAPAEQRIVHDGTIAALDGDGILAATIGSVRLLHGTSMLLPHDALILIPGAIVLVDQRSAGATPARAVALKRASVPRLCLDPSARGWDALEHAGVDVHALTDLGFHGSRALLPVLAHLALFQDAPRIPGAAADVRGAALGLVLRRLGDSIGERAFVPLEFVLRGAGAHLSARTGAIVRYQGELRYVERQLRASGDLNAFHALLNGWLATDEAGAAAASPEHHADERQPHALAIMSGSELLHFEDQAALATFLAGMHGVEHFVDMSHERPYARVGDGATRNLTPAEAAILLAYVARALNGGRSMCAESFPNPFSATPLGRQHAFKTMRMKVDSAIERGRYRLFPTVSTSRKGSTEYVFAPRSGVTYCFVALWSDYERTHAWLREVAD